MDITLKVLDQPEYKVIWQEAFEQHNIPRPEAYYDRCEYENQIGTRITLLAFVQEKLTGVSHLKFESDYPYFKDQNIPEINDLNVFPEYQRNGIANRIIEEFENIVRERLPRIGIGVGLYKDYGAAQRVYVRRGYIPDGNGLMYHHKPVVPGSMVCADDDLNLYLIKELV
ncbi:GNAT family N-acetyltransferase [Paenibacillus solani]|uniref:GNAT family N-acetyltransferase n=1 Tax=Paenibacillus solani TaxID=1705565 RepID=UPI003D27A1E9